ncbi:hypothetical protein KM043_010527 [Ampulex compressa]|nr:hypothetical protein KM043_010527 [Ampulex compressa]
MFSRTDNTGGILGTYNNRTDENVALKALARPGSSREHPAREGWTESDGAKARKGGGNRTRVGGGGSSARQASAGEAGAVGASRKLLARSAPFCRVRVKPAGLRGKRRACPSAILRRWTWRKERPTRLTSLPKARRPRRRRRAERAGVTIPVTG